MATAGIALAAAGVLTPLSAYSQTTNWTGATSTNWFTGTNWSAGVPMANQEAIINTQNPNGTVIATPGAVAEELFISNGSYAVLTVTGAGTVTADQIALSDQPTGFGTLNVVDGGTATATTALNVGQRGDGELNISTGGTASGAQVSIGGEAGATGTVNVDGVGSEIRETDPDDNFLFSVGFEGIGFLNVTNGGHAVSEGQTVVGANGTGVGTITVDGDGSLLRTEQGITVGNIGTGTVIVRNQGLFQSSFAILGAFDDYPGFPGTGDGTIEITGAGSQWFNSTTDNNATLVVGGQGASRVRVLHGGYLENNGQAQFGLGAGVLGTLTIDGTGSFVGISRSSFVGVNGEGRIDVTNGGQLATGRVGEVAGNSVQIGAQAGSTGSVRIDGDGSFWGSALPIAVGNNGTGSLVVTNGASASFFDDFVVGNSGMGSLRVTDGGTLLLGDRLDVGYWGGSAGSVLVSGPGSLIEATTYTSSDHRIGRGGDGRLTIRDSGRVVLNDGLAVGGLLGGAGAGLIEIIGPGSTLEVRQQWSISTVGYIGSGGGIGTVNIRDGGRLEFATVSGVHVQDNSSINVEGDGSSLSGLVTLSGHGSRLNITNGATVRSPDNWGGVVGLSWGSDAPEDALALVTVSGAGSEWTGTGWLQVGNFGSHGALHVLNGGVATFANVELANFSSTGTSRATVIVDGEGDCQEFCA